MVTNILLSGVSGYLGGSIAQSMIDAPEWSTLLNEKRIKVWGTFRSDEQATQARSLYGIERLSFDFNDPLGSASEIVKSEISIIVNLTSAVDLDRAVGLIKVLQLVKEKTGKTVHYIHTSGGKLFSNHGGRTSEEVVDDEQEYMRHKDQLKASQIHPIARQGITTDIGVLETGDEMDVRSYIVVPCIVYGRGTGFGRKISIQTKDVVRITRDLGKALLLNNDDDSWAFCSVNDIAHLYLALLYNIIQTEDAPYGKEGGFYFAVNGQIKWNYLYRAIAKSLFERGLIKDDELHKPTEKDRQAALESLLTSGTLITPEARKKFDTTFVYLSVSGQLCMRTVKADRIEWQPKDDLTHFEAQIDQEVADILQEYYAK